MRANIVLEGSLKEVLEFCQGGIASTTKNAAAKTKAVRRMSVPTKAPAPANVVRRRNSNYRRWYTKEETDKIVKMHSQGISTKVIARDLNRPYTTVQNRIWKLLREGKLQVSEGA